MYFQVHQPTRLRKYSVFDIGKNSNYFDEERNNFYLDRIVKKCYVPATGKILELVEKTDGRFRVSFSVHETQEIFPDHGLGNGRGFSRAVLASWRKPVGPASAHRPLWQ